MKKFFVKLIIMFFLISISFLGLNYAYIHSNAFYIANDTIKFKNVPKGIEICNLGSSHGKRSFDYSEVKEKGYNFGLAGQDFYYDFQILKQFSENLKKGAIVLIVVSYFSYNRELFDGSFFERNPRYYSFLRKELIFNYSFTDAIKYKYLPVTTAKANIINIFLNQKDKPQIYVKHNIELDEFKSHSQKKAETHSQRNSDESANIEYLKKIIEFCKENYFIPVLITPPFYETYSSYYPTEKINKFLNTTEGLAKREKIPYLNYSKDKNFINNIDLFLNSDHLNYLGAKKFTSKVVSTLKKMGFL